MAAIFKDFFKWLKFCFLGQMCLRAPVIFCFTLLLASQLTAQPEGAYSKTIKQIESRLEQPGGDTARYFILEKVSQHCGKDYDCLFDTYLALMKEMEKRFNLSLAISLGNEMVKIAAKKGDLIAEANSHKHLNRYHSAIGNQQEAILHLDKALHLYEKAGETSDVLRIKCSILEESLNFRKIEDVLPEIEALLLLAEKEDDKRAASYLRGRILLLARDSKLYDILEKHVTAVERMLQSAAPAQSPDYGLAIYASLGRAELLRAKNNIAEAERFFQEALRLSVLKSDRWLEIHTLHLLAQLEWGRNNGQLAKNYLDSSYTKAAELTLHDHLADNFRIKADIAEAEKRYADALDFIKKQAYHKAELANRGAGFDSRSYYLQQEKDKLATEKEAQDLALQLKKSQLRNSLIITFLVLLIAAGLFFGLRKQRHDKKELATQNALIRQQSETLKELDTAKSRFFANISHELRTPLTLVLGPINSLLKANQLSPKQVELLQMANRNGEQLNLLINEILDLRKLESGKMEVNLQPTQAAKFFRRHILQFESLAHRKGIDFNFDIRVDEQVFIKIDQEKCRQIVYNLLSNAFKFTPKGGDVKVKVKVEIGNWEIGKPTNAISAFHNFKFQVSDTGPGIHHNDLPYIFDAYFQTNQPGKSAEGGTGIGLALCREYAALFDGKIWVESHQGEGAAFFVEFPLEVIEQENMPETAELVAAPFAEQLDTESNRGLEIPTTMPDPAKPTVLVVEDNSELQDYIRLILQGKYNVVTAGNGQEALELLRDEERVVRNERVTPHPSSLIPDAPPLIPHPSSLIPDLVLSDLMMPIMDGYQLLEKLKSSEATRHIPVIMLTARAERDDRLKALRIGVDDYLTKPFDEEELQVRIANLLLNSSNRAALLEETAVANSLSLATEQKVDGFTISEADRAWLERFEAFVQKNISNELLAIPFLANEFAMSESTLLRQLKRLTGLSPVQYLQEVRLDKARYFLENRSYDSIAKVASKVGYGDVRNFSRSFKQRFGKSPTDFVNN